MDLDAVRTVVATAEAGSFHLAAAELAITQQAVSKRIAALEKDLGVRLFTRTPRGARLTLDGQAFLPHARALLVAAERALASVRPGQRALRVDVIGSRLAPSALLRGFHRAHPDTELDVVHLFDAAEALAALQAGAIDASFRAAPAPGHPLPGGILAEHVLDEPHDLLTGPAHALAGAASLTPARLVGHRIWIPGIVPGTEWAAYYEDLAAAFGLTIESTGPDFGIDALLDVIADTPALATLVGAQTRLVRPTGHAPRRIPVVDPTPVYPHALLWHRDNSHPALGALRAHLSAQAAEQPSAAAWTPGWARAWARKPARKPAREPARKTAGEPAPTRARRR
ncbi:LysR family transcriptional regulator [Streptomyces sp. NPDC051921]|uniref:LysR family transcriptional regulator n=1 Tax=Streptomyces sp. NPDC051921 TaxID=3155806 RepID=UPI00344A52EF